MEGAGRRAWTTRSGWEARARQALLLTQPAHGGAIARTRVDLTLADGGARLEFGVRGYIGRQTRRHDGTRGDFPTLVPEDVRCILPAATVAVTAAGTEAPGPNAMPAMPEHDAVRQQLAEAITAATRDWVFELDHLLETHLERLMV